MKKLLAVIVSVILLVQISACKIQNASSDPTIAPTDKKETVEESNLVSAAVSFITEYSDDKIVEWSEVLRLIDSDKAPFILSIRQQKLYDKGHIKGAYIAEWGEDLADKIDMLPKDKRVYIYCDNGQDSSQTAALLNMLGIDAVSINLGYTEGFLKSPRYKDYISRKENTLPDADAKFDKDILKFVKDYFNAIPDKGSNILPASQVNTLSQWGNVKLIDIRDAEDFERGHIETAVNVPFGENMLDDFEKYKDSKIILTDYNGQNSGHVVAVLHALGYDAYALKLGINLGWQPYIMERAANSFFEEYTGSIVAQWADIANMIDNSEAPYILSIRTKKEYSEGHVTGAYLAEWGEDLAEKISLLPDDERIYIYSSDGQTASQASIMCNIIGIDAVSIQGGFEAISSSKGYEKYINTNANEMPSVDSKINPFLLSSAQDYFANAIEMNSYMINSEDVKRAIDREQFIVIDIRSEKDFNAGHIDGATNIRIDENMPESISKLHSTNLIIADYSGQAAHQITAILRNLGYNALALDSGMTEYIDQKLPLAD
ncbi:MAG: rhodanese-like domain-containing protein [Eubacteriales bacterium]